MRRVDLRKSDDFLASLEKTINEAKSLEVLVILFEIKDFSPVEAVFDFVNKHNCTLLNSLKFNQVDWTIVIKKEAK